MDTQPGRCVPGRHIPQTVAWTVAVEIAILPVTESDPSLLQALEVSSPGSGGLVFDRVDALDPPLGPFPSGRLRLTG